MRKQVGFDLNGWSDMAARNWQVKPGEDTEYGGPFEFHGGVGGVVVTLDEASGDHSHIGGLQALMAPHGRGGGWGTVGKQNRRDHIVNLLEKPEDNVKPLAAALAAFAPGGKATGILSIDDTPNMRETAQEALLKALREAGIPHGLLVWRPVLALLFALELELEKVSGARKVGVVSHCAQGFSTQVLRLRDDALPTPERRHVGRLHPSGLGLQPLRDQANRILQDSLGNDLGEVHLDAAQFPWRLALGKICQPEVLRATNSDWYVLSPTETLSLPDDPLPTAIGDHLASCDVVIFETPAEGRVAQSILERLQQNLMPVPVLALRQGVIANGARVAAERLQKNQVIYFDFLPQVSTIVQDGDVARNEDLIPDNARLPAGEVYRSQQPEMFVLQQGTDSLSIFLKKENVEYARKAIIDLPTPPKKNMPVALSVEQSPASGRARLTLVSEGFSAPLVVDWDAAEELGEDWQTIIDLQQPSLPTVPNRLVLPCGMDSWEGQPQFHLGLPDGRDNWEDQPQTLGLTRMLEQNQEAHHINWQQLANILSARPEGHYAVSSDGELPQELDINSKNNLNNFIELAETDIRNRLEGEDRTENHSLRFLTWLFHRCPQWIVAPMIAAMGSADHPFRIAGAMILLPQGIGRTARDPDDQRRAFDFLLNVPASDWNNNHLACASFLLSRNDNAPTLLSRMEVEFLAGIAAERMRSALGGPYAATFIYVPFLLVGLLRWRLKESQALVAGSDPVADEMLEATEQVIQDLDSRNGNPPRLERYRIILLDVVEELKGQGTNPNLLLDLEIFTR